MTDMIMESIPNTNSNPQVAPKPKIFRPWCISEIGSDDSGFLDTSGEAEASFALVTTASADDSAATERSNGAEEEGSTVASVDLRPVDMYVNLNERVKIVNSFPAVDHNMVDAAVEATQGVADLVPTDEISADNTSVNLDNARPVITVKKQSKPRKRKSSTKKQTSTSLAPVSTACELTHEDDSLELPGLCSKEEERWYVEKVLGYRVKSNRDQFLVKWKEWDEIYNSWEPSDNVDDCMALVKEYFDKNPNQKTKYLEHQIKIMQAEMKRLESGTNKPRKRKANALTCPQPSNDDAPTEKPCGTISLANEASSILQDFVAQDSNNATCPKTKKGKGGSRKLAAARNKVPESSLNAPSHCDATAPKPTSVQSGIGHSKAIGSFQKESATDGIQKKKTKKSSVRLGQGKAGGPSKSDPGRVLAVTAATPRHNTDAVNVFQSRKLVRPGSGEVEGQARAGVGEDRQELPNGENRSQMKVTDYEVCTKVTGRKCETLKSYTVNKVGEPQYLIRFYDDPRFYSVPHSVAVANFPDFIRTYLWKFHYGIDYCKEVHDVHKDPGFNPLDRAKELCNTGI